MWTKILEKMYEERDAQILHDRIKEVVGMRSRTAGVDGPAVNAQRKLTRVEMSKEVENGNRKHSQLLYADFKKVILDFQLQEHERFLQKFTDLFKSVDNDGDGVITEVQF